MFTKIKNIKQTFRRISNTIPYPMGVVKNDCLGNNFFGFYEFKLNIYLRLPLLGDLLSNHLSKTLKISQSITAVGLSGDWPPPLKWPGPLFWMVAIEFQLVLSSVRDPLSHGLISTYMYVHCQYYTTNRMQCTFRDYMKLHTLLLRNCMP